MNKITKDNLSSFMEYYHDFHDSNILYINYNIEKAKIEILINVYWSGEPTSNENGSYNTNKTKLKMVLKSAITKNYFLGIIYIMLI